MLVECKNCGAPLDVGSGARQVKCGYCRMASPVRSMRTLAAQAPADWRPPPVWTPPAQSAQPSVALYYSATTAQGGNGSLGLVVAGLAVMAVVVGAVAIFFVSSRSSQSMSTGSGPDRQVEPIDEPAVVAPDPGRLNEPLVVSTKTPVVTPAVPPPAARPASTLVRKVTPKPTATPPPPPPPPPTAKPKPPPKSKCGCAPGDLMCAMKCAQK